MPDVLICERDHSVAQSWAELLAADGHTVSVVEPVKVAVEGALSEPCGMVVVTVSPGDDEGLELIPAVHEVDQKMPVVVVGETESLELEREARIRKVFYYLVQPVEPDELKAVVGRALGTRSSDAVA